MHTFCYIKLSKGIHLDSSEQMIGRRVLLKFIGLVTPVRDYGHGSKKFGPLNNINRGSCQLLEVGQTNIPRPCRGRGALLLGAVLSIWISI